MELLYIWVEDYKNIYRQGFNFSPKHNFEFIPEYLDAEIINGELTHENIEYNLSDDFFGNTIVNVTGIVGKNGSGKSSLLEIISNIGHYPKSNNNDVSIKLLVFNDEKKGIIIFHDYKIERIIAPPNMIKLHYFDTYYYKKKIKINFYPNIKEFNENIISSLYQWADVVFYKNNIDVSNNLIASQYDISTQRRIENANNYREYKQNELNTILKFIEENKKNKNLNIKFPDYVEIIFFHHSNKLSSWGDGALFSQEELTKLKSKFISLIESQKYKTISENFKEVFMLNLFWYALYYNAHTEMEIKSWDISKLIQELLKNKNPVKIINSYIDNQNSGEYANKMKHLREIIEKYSSKLNLKRTDYNGFKILIDEEFIKFSNEIFKHEIYNSHIFDYSWYGLSSGEEAFLSFFARCKQEVRHFYNLLFLIDEGELMLHPEWQKNFFYNIIRIIPTLFPDAKFHFIFTSHSPFIVSDLPKEHIIFLDKDKETGRCKVVPDIDQKETFGANIHTLFTSSFFMNDGLIGKFAEEKIQGVIDYLNKNKNTDVKTTDDAQAIINIIGEPILKNQLQKMLNLKIGNANNSEIDVLKKQMRYLKSKISKLEN